MLRNWSIRAKLVAVLIVPLLALTLLSALQVRGNVNAVHRSDRVRTLASFSITANDLVDALQNERFATSSYVGSGYHTNESTAVTTRKPVDTALATFQAAAAKLPADAAATIHTGLGAATRQAGQLTAQRRRIDARATNPSQNSTVYTALIGDLLSLDAQVASGSSNPDLVRGAATLVSISQAKEAADQQRGYASVILFLSQANPQIVGLVQTNIGTEQAWLSQFRTTATANERASYDRTVGGSARTANTLRDNIVLAAQARGGRSGVDPNTWLAAQADKLARLRTVERGVATDLAAEGKSIADHARRQAWLGGLAALVILLLSIGISLLIATPMIRRLRRLRSEALEVATHRLPSVVDRLQHGERVEVTEEVSAPPTRSTDEIGQVAEAFTTVHRVAVETAVEQAAMRKSVGDTFLNLARRSQALIHRQLKVIDGLERKESDPAELQELFRLDHLATRMRRHAEDLIVLSGSKPARGWRKPVALKDVVRGAVAEVEDYTRVKVLPIAEAAVNGHAVGDVIHLLAELIENATSFSPPHTPVQVSGHEVSNGCVIEVEDRGLGMTRAEFDAINSKLANPPPFDLSTSERLGLFVVGRLAQRHSIRVQLRSSPYGGTTVIVLLPAALIKSLGTVSEPLSGGRNAAPRVVQSRVGSVVGRAPVTPPVSALSPAGEEPIADDLPVFATARSSWFVAERPNPAAADRGWDGADVPDDRYGEPDEGDGFSGFGGFGGSAYPPEPADDDGFGPALPRRGSRGDRRAALPPGDDDRAELPAPEDADLPADDHLDDHLDATLGADAYPVEDFLPAPERPALTAAEQPAPTDGTPPTADDLLAGAHARDADEAAGFGQDGLEPDDPDRNGRARDGRARDGLGRDGLGQAGRDGEDDGAPAPDEATEQPARRQPASHRASRQNGAERQTTEVGLPKRTRRASLVPQLRSTGPKENDERAAMVAGPRSPEEVRTMMTSFQSNFDRGLHDAPAEIERRGESADERADEGDSR